MDTALFIEVQTALCNAGILAPPADGRWGRFSTSALADQQAAHGLPLQGIEAAQNVPDQRQPHLPLAGGTLASAICIWHQKNNFWYAVGEEYYNICYVEGMWSDGVRNSDAPDQFNDARIVWQVIDGVPVITGSWDGTSEPGWHFTVNRMNPKGAARIQFGQYRAWEYGFHNWDRNHPALIQVGPITVVRDRDNSMTRNAGDYIDTGSGFFINQHHGFDNPWNLVGRASAGCLVGRSSHRHLNEFMPMILRDARYRQNKNYLFSTTIIPADAMWRDTQWGRLR